MSGDHNMHCSGNQPDIVTRLRARPKANAPKYAQQMFEAADEIERLRAERDCLQYELGQWMNHWRTKL